MNIKRSTDRCARAIALARGKRFTAEIRDIDLGLYGLEEPRLPSMDYYAVWMLARAVFLKAGVPSSAGSALASAVADCDAKSEEEMTEIGMPLVIEAWKEDDSLRELRRLNKKTRGRLFSLLWITGALGSEDFVKAFRKNVA